MADAVKPLILVADDDESHRLTINKLAATWGYEVHTAKNGEEASEKSRKNSYSVILMDIRMAVMDGITALHKIKSHDPSIPIIIMTAYSSVASAVEALKSGAYDYLTKPLDFDELKITLERASDHARLKAENLALKSQIRTQAGSRQIIGNSVAMRNLKATLSMVAPSEATVLITGESGTGKEMVARLIHLNSLRHDRPFIAVNCASINENLLESELFGHEKGAFTGAISKRNGIFMQADKGTIFLDEIAEMTPHMQAKLLRVIQEREVQRVGGEEYIKIDVRIIAATHQDLVKRVKENTFREDLFYRLNVVNMRVPSLREKTEDIPSLCQYFIARLSEKNRKNIIGISPDAIKALISYDWPGNVRELENMLERAVILSIGEYVTESELPPSISKKNDENILDKCLSLEDIEKKAIMVALDAAGWNKSEAARQLGINRKTLHKKLKSYGID
ncbi:sigma-54-dependent transcriptional regulator [Desulforegula conservatrix]|uniref:sigma-54-dependent transcriptional regulator n=1 Tax=Desulforegula conservatrix TaxID=153026 RepID=UPI000428B3BD|nr:sigma-54 dependent transcriptional regulator [Desulforegula conservatrix]